MNRETIATEIADILELPRRGRKGKAWRIANAVVQAMTTALCRGETVRVDGFGMFKIRERAPRLHHYYYFPYLGKGQHSEIAMRPGKKYVQFFPARTLLRMLNG